VKEPDFDRCVVASCLDTGSSGLAQQTASYLAHFEADSAAFVRKDCHYMELHIADRRILLDLDQLVEDSLCQPAGLLGCSCRCGRIATNSVGDGLVRPAVASTLDAVAVYLKEHLLASRKKTRLSEEGLGFFR
jgi:hypothetical protein